MAQFKLSLLTMSIPVNTSTDGYDIKYFSNVISEFDSHDTRLNFCYTYNENVSFHKNAQKELTFSMDRMVMKGDTWLENPFVKHMHNGTTLLLEDKYGQHHLFTITNISYAIREINITYNITCRDSFSYQLSRQNEGYTINNDPTSDDFLGAKNIDEWTQNYIIPECYIQSYSYLPLNKGLYLTKTQEDTPSVLKQFSYGDNLTDVDVMIKRPYTPISTPEYYETFPFAISGSTANGALIALAEELGLMVRVYEYLADDHHIRKFFWYEPERNERNNGLMYSPYTDIQSFSFEHRGESLTSILNVTGANNNDQLITLFPAVTPFFNLLFNSNLWAETTYYPGMFKELCEAKRYYLTDEMSAQADLQIELDKENTKENEYYDFTLTNTDESTLFINPLYQYYTLNTPDWISELTLKLSDQTLKTFTINSNKWALILNGTEFLPGQEIPYTYRGQKVSATLRIFDDSASTSASLVDYNIAFSFTRDVTQEDIDFAEAADRCPWLENKLIDFKYFLDHGLLTSKEYQYLMDYICNNLRIINGQLILAADQYSAALQERTTTIADLTNSIDSLGAAAQAVFVRPYQETGAISLDTSYFDNAYNSLFTPVTTANVIPELLDYNATLANYFDKMFWTEQRFLKNIYSFTEYFNAPAIAGSEITIYKYNFELTPSSDSTILFESDSIYTKLSTSALSNVVNTYQEPLATWYVNFPGDNTYKFSPEIVTMTNFNQYYQLTDAEKFLRVGDKVNPMYADWIKFYRPILVIDSGPASVIEQLKTLKKTVKIDIKNDDDKIKFTMEFKIVCTSDSIHLEPTKALKSYNHYFDYNSDSKNGWSLGLTRVISTLKAINANGSITELLLDDNSLNAHVDYKMATQKDLLQNYLLGLGMDKLSHYYTRSYDWNNGGRSSTPSIYTSVQKIHFKPTAEINTSNGVEEFQLDSSLIGSALPEHLDSTFISQLESIDQSSNKFVQDKDCYFKYIPITELYYSGHRYQCSDVTKDVFGEDDFVQLTETEEIIKIPLVTMANESKFFRRAYKTWFGSLFSFYESDFKHEGWSSSDVTWDHYIGPWSNFKMSQYVNYVTSAANYDLAIKVLNNSTKLSGFIEDYYYYQAAGLTIESARTDHDDNNKWVNHKHATKLSFKDTYMRVFKWDEKPNPKDTYYLYLFKDSEDARNQIINATRFSYPSYKGEYYHISLVRNYNWLHSYKDVKMDNNKSYNDFQELLQDTLGADYTITTSGFFAFVAAEDANYAFIIMRKEDYVYHFLKYDSVIDAYNNDYYDFETNALVDFKLEADFVQGFYVDGNNFGGIQPATTFDSSGQYFKKLGLYGYERVYTAHQLLNDKPYGDIYTNNTTSRTVTSLTPLIECDFKCRLVSRQEEKHYSTITYITETAITSYTMKWEWRDVDGVTKLSDLIISNLTVEELEKSTKYIYTFQVLETVKEASNLILENTAIYSQTGNKLSGEFTFTPAARYIITNDYINETVTFSTSTSNTLTATKKDVYTVQYTCTQDQKVYTNLTNGAFWYYFSNKLNSFKDTDTDTLYNAELFRKAAEIEHQLTVYWQSAYSASLYCNYFIPEYWQNHIEGTNNSFFAHLITITNTETTKTDTGSITLNIRATLNPQYIPTVKIFKLNGTTQLPYFNFGAIETTSGGQSLRQLADYRPIMDALKYTFPSEKMQRQLYTKISAQDLNYLTTYYYVESGGQTWAQALQEWTGGSKYNEYSGLYPLILKRLLSSYKAAPKLRYEELIEQQQTAWGMLQGMFPTILLESSYSNDTASTAAELYFFASNAFKDMAAPERAYNIALIDTQHLKGYQGQELKIGDSIAINSGEYYNGEDDIKKSLSQFLFITDISYNLRSDSDLTLTVNSIKYQDKLIQRLAKLIRK